MAYEDLKEQFREGLARNVKGGFTTITAEVIEVDLQNFSIDVEPGGDMAEVFDVRLRASLDSADTGLILVPKVGSTVLITAINNNWNSAFMTMATVLDKVLLKIEDTTMELSAAGMILNGGALGGLVKAKELQAQLNKTNAVVKALMDAIATWVPVPADGGAALKTIMGTQLAGKTLGSFADIENTKIKHG